MSNQFVGTLYLGKGGYITSGVSAYIAPADISGGIGSGILQSGAVNSGNISSGSVAWFCLGSGAVVSGTIASGQIGVNHLASGLLSGAATNTSGNFPANYIFGLNLFYVDSTHINVTSGQCRDALNSQNITLGSGVQVNLGVTDQVNGNVRKTLTGTIFLASGKATVSGTGTLFLTDFGTRAGTGTLVAVSGSILISGVGSHFLSEVHPVDMIGNSTVGYSRVTAVNGDTSLTVVSGLPGGLTSGTAFNIIEEPLLRFGATNAYINTIKSNTILDIQIGSIIFASGATAITGDLSTVAVPNNQDGFFYVVNGTSGTGAIVSTQRTVPFLPPGYGSGYRRIGWDFVISNTNTFAAITQVGENNKREYNYQFALTGNSSRILSNGTANATWTGNASVPANGLAPPSAYKLLLQFAEVPTGGNISDTYVRYRSGGTSDTTRPLYVHGNANQNNSAVLWVHCDPGQGFDYTNSNAAGGTYIDLIGFEEEV